MSNHSPVPAAQPPTPAVTIPGVGQPPTHAAPIPGIGQPATQEVLIPGATNPASHDVSISDVGQQATHDVSIPGLGQPATHDVPTPDLGQPPTHDVTIPRLGQPAGHDVPISGATNPASHDVPIPGLGQPATHDVTILGAGPAGLCAALRLAELGWRVALVESCVFPRPQIGESLSPGIFSLFDYLGVGHLLKDEYYLRELPARVLWEDADNPGELVSKNGFMVDRARLDAALLAEAIRRGVTLLPTSTNRGVDREPASVRQTTDSLATGQITDSLATGHTAHSRERNARSRIVLDCRGRRGVRAVDRVMTAPASLALWVQVPGSVMPREARVEALPAGWLWGAPLPGGEYRVMAFVDPGLVKARGPNAVLSKMLAESQLFGAAAKAVAKAAAMSDAMSAVPAIADAKAAAIADAKAAAMADAMSVAMTDAKALAIADAMSAVPALQKDPQACPVFHYVHREPWRDDYIRVGEAAFTIDPLSSSGVEKAMRHALQVAIAVNTILKSGDAALAKNFYYEKLVRSVADHTAWTRGYYSRAWPGPRYPFWRERSEQPEIADRPDWLASSPTASSTINAISEKQRPPTNPAHSPGANSMNSANSEKQAPTPEQAHPAEQIPIDVTQLLNRIWTHPPRLSEKLQYSQSCCVVGDIVEQRPSIRHPRLEDALVYLGGIELKPLLDMVPATATYGELLHCWSRTMPVEQAGKMLAFLCTNEVLC